MKYFMLFRATSPCFTMIPPARSCILKKKLSTGINMFNPSPDDTLLDWSKLKQIADDILKCIQMENEYQIG